MQLSVLFLERFPVASGGVRCSFACSEKPILKRRVYRHWRPHFCDIQRANRVLRQKWTNRRTRNGDDVCRVKGAWIQQNNPTRRENTDQSTPTLFCWASIIGRGNLNCSMYYIIYYVFCWIEQPYDTLHYTILHVTLHVTPEIIRNIYWNLYIKIYIVTLLLQKEEYFFFKRILGVTCYFSMYFTMYTLVYQV
jgi:hypothetical protein